MNKETKITYAVMSLLVVSLGGVALFLQNNRNLPQVQITEQVLGRATTTAPIKRTIVNNYNNKRNQKSTTTNSTTTMNTTTNTKTATATTTTTEIPEKITSAMITTNKGDIEITFSEKTPETVKNFAKLAVSDFYNGTRFHRVIRDFMIQGGDPLSKDVANKNSWGTGGPGYSFKDEISPNDVFSQGTLAMANSGPDTNGSQFFIVTAIAGTPWLAGKHTVFGHVTKGLDVVLHIGDMQTDGADRPLQDVIVEKVVIK